MMTNIFGTILTLGVLLVGLYVYFPTIVAVFRNHRQLLAIFVLNLFLGWTLVGWVIALVWACIKT
jgi:hypothetical protein